MVLLVGLHSCKHVPAAVVAAVAAADGAGGAIVEDTACFCAGTRLFSCYGFWQDWTQISRVCVLVEVVVLSGCQCGSTLLPSAVAWH